MNWNLIGHEWAVQLLGGHINNKSLRHAYLISGPRGIGKQSLALHFIQAILCQNASSPGIPCFSCSNCQRLERMEHPDLLPVRVEEGNSKIKVDQIRDLMHSLSLSPYESNHKIGLIIDIENATPQTQNALLKTLEEPPGTVILILTTTSVDAVLDTILSRCEQIKLNTVPISKTISGLEEIHSVPTDQAKFLAHISGGKPINALSFYKDQSKLEQRSIFLDDLMELMTENSVDRFSYVKQITKDPDQVLNILDTWYSLWHDVLIKTGKSQTEINNIDRDADLQKILNEIDLDTAKKTIQLFKKAVELIKTNANLKLTLEDLLLQLPTLKG
jgi:DNA polymerase-3 subunit delta'